MLPDNFQNCLNSDAGDIFGIVTSTQHAYLNDLVPSQHLGVLYPEAARKQASKLTISLEKYNKTYN